MEAARQQAINIWKNVTLGDIQNTWRNTSDVGRASPTNTTEQSSSWDADSSSASKETGPSLNNPNVHCHCHNSPQPVPILSQINPVHAQPSFLRFNIILPSMSGSSKWSLSFGFPHQNSVRLYFLSHTFLMPCLFHSSSFHDPNTVIPRLTSDPANEFFG
jgi:hypothetical protein